jgi:hypothetical protein
VGEITIKCEPGKVSDGYHTFDDLYDHRCHLMIALMICKPEQSWRSDKNDDGEKWTCWFTAGINLPSGTITYHLPQWMWSMLDNKNIETFDIAPKWDGHTSEDVVKRLAAWIESI